MQQNILAYLKGRLHIHDISRTFSNNTSFHLCLTCQPQEQIMLRPGTIYHEYTDTQIMFNDFQIHVEELHMIT